MNETSRFGHIDSAVRKKLESAKKWSKKVNVNEDVDYATVFLEQQVHGLKNQLDALNEVDADRASYKQQEADYIETVRKELMFQIDSITKAVNKLTK